MDRATLIKIVNCLVSRFLPAGNPSGPGGGMFGGMNPLALMTEIKTLYDTLTSGKAGETLAANLPDEVLTEMGQILAEAGYKKTEG